MLRLHDYWRSSAAYRVRIALNLKGVAYEAIRIDLLGGAQGQAANRSVNAQGLVPSLVLDDGTALTQSLAILGWLDDAYPEPLLWPRDPIAKARASARALVVVADVHPLNNLRVLGRLEAQFGADADAKKGWYRHWVELGLAALEEMADGAGPFLSGDAPDVSDVCLVPQLFNARRFDVDLTPYPKLVAADVAANALPAFQAAHPDRVRPD
ncbi:maleylacetoacetate isomerase [Sphingomonas lenta]|uniref:Maleylacetoacetate isomerase n=1 Tax=Sphingomonas lenta TaxID=1141887 RepID=A0A2A2SCD4_9SPHN|nr:maleylacetoacetate isomerase [Sphingomonas lenta]PAX06909.1 maleylacetoacetate isomerase [Sphingomonas lenta]